MSPNGRKLRSGFTTGSCAALAAGAATRMALTGGTLGAASLVTPRGTLFAADLCDVWVGVGAAACSVRKDAGDDPDVTDGLLVRVEARRAETPGIAIDGGAGVGRVTRKGLDQPVGAAAINSVPRRMIAEEVARACAESGYAGGMAVTVSVPGGEEVAARTFNPAIGIVGGLSILGTSGVVEPMSDRALVDTIAVEMRVRRAEGATEILLVPGNYGADFVARGGMFPELPVVKCANFIGEALDLAGESGFAAAVVVGHLGKIAKLAGGVMETHSRVADGRMETLALFAALAGADRETTRRVLDAVAVDEAVATLAAAGLRDEAMRGLVERAEAYARRRAGGALATGVVVYSGRFGLLGVGADARRILGVKESGMESRKDDNG